VRTDAAALWWKGTPPVLTAHLLDERYNACEARVEVFEKQFPTGVVLDANGLESAITLREGRGVLWFWNHVLSPDQRSRIKEVFRGRFSQPWRQLKFGPSADRRAVAEVVAAELRETGLVPRGNANA